jgi:hypothetical protein
MTRIGGSAVALALAVSAAVALAPLAPAATAATPAPAAAYLINADGSFYTLAFSSMTVQNVGNAQPDSWGLAADSDGQLYELAGATTQSLYRVSRSTGTVTLVGALDAAQPANSYYGAIGTPSNGRLYTELTLPESAMPNQFASVDRTSGAATPIGAGNDAELMALAGGCGGRLYGVDARKALVTVNTTSGAASVIGTLSSSALQAGELPISLAMDHGTGVMWLLTKLTNDAKRLWRVNINTGALTLTSYVDGQQGASPVAIAIDSPARCRYARKLTIAYSKLHQRFQGALTSSFASCFARRQVIVYRKRSGPDAKVGTATTGRGGAYHLPKAFRHGTFYAVAPQVSASGVCLRATSTSRTL